MKLIVKKFDVCDYQEIWQQMHDFTAERGVDTPDELWLLQHYPVFTQGQAGRPEHVLNPGDIPIVQTNRGGQVTYHGPGQLVGYPLIDLRRRSIGVKQFVNILETSVVKVLADYNIKASNRDDAPGVYVIDSGAKICSIGLKISHGCSYHGIAFNVDMDLEPFSRINPCGYKNLQMTQIKDFVPDVDFTEVQTKFTDYFQQELP